METKSDVSDPNDVFLAGLATALESQDGVDHELAAFLRTHLLKVGPDADAVARVLESILDLARERASSQTVVHADA